MKNNKNKNILSHNNNADDAEGINKILIKIDDFFRKIIHFVKTNSKARLLFKFFIVFLICITVLIIMYFILKPGVDNYYNGIYASYVKDIFVNEENKGEEIKIKEEIDGDASNIYYVYRVEIGGRLIGYAFKEDIYGYKSTIEFMVGIYKDKSLAGVEVIEHNETPRMTWFLDDRDYLSHFASSYLELPERDKIIYEQNLPNDARQKDFKSTFGVDTVTGATVSMNALLRAVLRSFDKVGSYVN